MCRSELPDDSSVLGVLPLTIDTPMNRKFMADADFYLDQGNQRCVRIFLVFEVTRMLVFNAQAEDIGEKILEWSDAPYAARPSSGHLITATTENNTTTWKDVGNPFQ